MTSLSVGAFNIGSSTAGLRLDVKDLNVKMDMSWKYKTKIGFPRGSGTATATLSDGNIGGTFLLGMKDGKPTLSAKSVTCAIHKISLKTHHSFFSWLYNIILKAFSSGIKGTMEKTVREGITTGIAAASATILNTLPMESHVANWGSINYSLTGGAQHLNNAIVVPFNGEITDISTKKSDGTVSRHNVALNPDSHLFQLLVDTFVFNSGLHTAYKKGVFHKVVDKTSGAKSPLPMHTSAYKVILPQLYKLYPDADMKADIVFAAQPSVAANTNSFALAIPTAYQFSVLTGGKWKHVFTVRNDASGDVDVHIDQLGAGQAIFAKINSLATKYTFTDSSVGSPDLSLLNGLLDFVLKSIVVPAVNAELFAGIPLPLAHGMQLSNTKFNFVKDAVRISTDLTYKP
jgi:hypothetical protein